MPISSATSSPTSRCANKQLTAHGVRIPQSKKNGRQAAYSDLVVLSTVESGKPHVFQTLLDFGLNVNHNMDKIGSPLSHAISRKDVEMVRFLLSKGADPNDQYWIPSVAVLERAAYHSSREIMHLLLDHGVWSHRDGFFHLKKYVCN